MIEKTKDYSIFILRPDNRAKIDQKHVQRLTESIKARNLLEMRPILVNDGMEVIDGQHRLMAASALGIEIYYEIQAQLGADDIVKMNISKPWGQEDYLNFYCQHGYPEYLKLKDFMVKNALSIRIAVNFSSYSSKTERENFKQGKFVFRADILTADLDTCWDTLDIIKKVNGYNAYTHTSRFWSSLISLVRDPIFNRDKWLANCEKLATEFGPKNGEKAYLKMLVRAYNWRNQNPVKLLEAE